MRVEKMTTHQRRLWGDMVRAIDLFLQGERAFDQMVGDLESALDAGDFKDRELVARWYDHWQDLETQRAAHHQSGLFVEDEARADAEAMREFLTSTVPDLST